MALCSLKWPTNSVNGWTVACKNGISAEMPPTLALKYPMRRANIFMFGWIAPIGYMASFKNLCDREGMDFDHYWNKDSKN